MNFSTLVVLALASTVGAARFGGDSWLGKARISAKAEVNDCKLNGVKSLNLGGNLEMDLNDETSLNVEYDYNDLNNGDLPRSVNVKWNHADGGNNYGVDADLNLADKSAKAEVSFANGDLSAKANFDSSNSNYLTGAEATYSMDAMDRNLKLTPSYDLDSQAGHLKAAMDVSDDIKAELGVDLNSDPASTLRVDYRIDDSNSVAPEVNLRDGSMTVEYTRKLGDASELVVNVEPNKNVNFEWKEGGSWTTNVNVPWNNAENSDISFKRNFQL